MSGVGVAPRTGPVRRRGLWIGLFASLAVNIFLVGWVASSWVYGPRFAPPPRHGRDGMPFLHHRALRAVQGKDREIAEQIWRDNLPELRKRLQELRDSHAQLRDAFTADTADAKSMSAAVASLKAKANGVYDLVNATLLKIAAALPPDARKAYFGAGIRSPRRSRH
jgi:uncharacterized membrane protein